MVVAILISGIRSRDINDIANIIKSYRRPEYSAIQLRCALDQENAENSADECLSCASITFSAIFS
jgi:hypothetical protein